MTFWQLAHSGPAEWDIASLAEAYVQDNGTAVNDASVSAWLSQRARAASYTADVLGTSRAAAETARSWEQARQNVSEIAAAVREIASPGNPDEAEVARMSAADWAKERLRYVKDYDQSERYVGMFGEQQTRVSLADRQPFDIWKQRKEHQ